MAKHPKALATIALAMAAVFAPPEALTPSKWMADNLVVPDGPRAGGLWDPTLTPYIPDIVDALGPDSPHNMVAVRKSAQTGISVAAIGLVASYIDKAPCRIGFALPTIDALQEFNAEKLTPTIEGTSALARRIRPQTSRSATGSTVTRKVFAGGSLSLINANSPTDLKSKTLKVGVGDEVDEWEQDLAGQGDPWRMFEKRFTSFHASGDYRNLALSTPTAEGTSRIDAMYLAGDQRKWHVRCPHCATEITLEFAHLRFEKTPPHGAFYAAQCCGGVIEHHEKAALVRAGRFIPTNADGLYPSFHVDALISQVTTWDKIAAEFVEAGSNERKLKQFYNQTLGQTYRIRGDAPDHIRLYERREDYAGDRVPPLGLLLTAGVDVQHSGLWLHVDAWAPDAQSWLVTSRFLQGDTTDANLGAWAKLAEVYDERFEDAYGNRRTIDGMAIDAGDGGRANQVYQFCHARSRAHAIKGMPGWGKPAFGPTPTHVRIKFGKRKRRGELWPVGTWDIKAGYYDDLRKDDDEGIYPPGYCHHHTGLDEGYFQQITAEYLADSKRQGRIVKVWTVSGANHLLDARTYSRAVAEYLGLTRMTREQWLKLAQRWQVPAAAGDLFAPDALQVQREAPPADQDKIAEDLGRALAGRSKASARKRSRFAKLKRRR